jgi:hypothetical protein
VTPSRRPDRSLGATGAKLIGEIRHHLPVMPTTVLRALGVAVALVCWTFVFGSCAGIVTMSGAHTITGEWPVGATVTLVVLALAWAGVPAVLW